MTDFCQLMKDTRQSLGLSLEDVAQRTYIKLPYLQALEEGAVERLPAPVYTYGYIRQVAKLLGLDGSALVAKFQQLERGVAPTGAALRSAPAMADLPGDSFNPFKPSFGGNGNGRHVPEGPASVPSSLQSVVPAVPNGHYMAADADAIEVRQAKMQAQQILTAAEREAHQMVRGAERYADEVLSELEAEIGKTLQIVRNGRQFLQSRRQPGPSGPTGL